MRLSIRLKLSLVLLVTVLSVVGAMYVIMQWSFETGFVSLVESHQHDRVALIVARLGEVYDEDGGWQPLLRDRHRWVGALLGERVGSGRRLPRWARHYLSDADGRWPPHSHSRSLPSHGSGTEGDDDVFGERGELRVAPLELRLFLLDSERSVLIGPPELPERVHYEPVDVRGVRVGWLGVLPGPALNDVADIRFFERQRRIFFLIAVAMAVLAAVLALPLAGTMTKRLRTVTEATRGLAEGNYDVRIPLTSADELGELAMHVNELAAGLQRTEHSRRQWVADISHELRTPLAVQRAELEAMHDGVRPLDVAGVDSLLVESRRLERLVDDLYDLTMSDLGTLSYRKRELDVVAVIEEAIDSVKSEFGHCDIAITTVYGTGARTNVYADADRLAQLFRNLLANTLHYTDPGGVLKIQIERVADRLRIVLQDSTPGVPPEEIDRLFDRFYRVESSRSRSHGGAGLGLAICQSIVMAHHGNIEAFASPQGGLGIKIELPISS